DVGARNANAEARPPDPGRRVGGFGRRVPVNLQPWPPVRLIVGLPSSTNRRCVPEAKLPISWQGRGSRQSSPFSLLPGDGGRTEWGSGVEPPPRWGGGNSARPAYGGFRRGAQ